MTHTARDATDTPYSLLVSSCDAYADCWNPFFTLLSRYWRPSPPPIYLNTETQDFTFPGLDIRCPRVGLTTSRRLAWSDRLRRSLQAIPDDLVLYLQEDYFIEGDVDVATIDRLAGLMRRECIDHISLGAWGRAGQRSPHELLSYIDHASDYVISAQAGLWNRRALISHLRRHESVWEFEWYGTRRARRQRRSFLCVSPDYEALAGKPVIPYVPTGVVHGRWVRDVVEELFAAHEIDVDFATRGFLDEHDDSAFNRRPLLVKAARRLRSIP